MRGSIYINETGPDQVSMNFSASPSELARTDTAYGFAFLKSIEHLGLQTQPDMASQLAANLVVEGSVETMRENTANLHKHIGLIARYGAERAHPGESKRYIRDDIGRKLGSIVQRQIPDLPENASLMYAMGVLAEPFADEVCDDGATVYYARPAGGILDRPVVKGKDSQPLGPLDTLDIGGLVIDRYGRPAGEHLQLSLAMPESYYSKLAVIGHVNEQGVADEIRDALKNFLAEPSNPAIDQESDHFDEPVDTPSRIIYASVSIPRADLRRIDEEYEPGVTFNDVLRTAVQKHIDTYASNPEVIAATDLFSARLAKLMDMRAKNY